MTDFANISGFGSAYKSTRDYLGKISSSIVFLFRDSFTTPDPPPMEGTRTAEPGPGTLITTDTGNYISLNGGSLHTPGNYNTLNTDPRVFSFTKWARSIGQAAYFRYVSKNATPGQITFGWDTVETVRPNDQVWEPLSTGVFRLRAGSGVTTLHGASVVQDAWNDIWVVQRDPGGFYIKDFVLHFVDAIDTGNMYVGLGVGTVNNGRAASFAAMNVHQLPAPWDTQTGLATDTITTPAAGNTFTHEANFVAIIDIDTLGGVGRISIRFRMQDADNNWAVWVNAAGDVILYEEVATTLNIRGSALASFSGGEKMVIICDNEDILIYNQNAQVIHYSGAANFKTETSGDIETHSAGFASSDFEIYPRVITGAAKTALRKMAKT